MSEYSVDSYKTRPRKGKKITKKMRDQIPRVGPGSNVKIKKKKKLLPYSPPKGSGTQTVTKGDSYKDYPESTNPDLKGGYKSKTRTVIKDGKKVKEKYLVPHKTPLKFKMKKKK